MQFFQNRIAKLKPSARRSLFSRTAICPSLMSVVLFGGVFCQAQTTSINLATQGRNADFSTFPFTRPVSVGTTLPSTCQVGQLFFNTTAAPGSNLYGCTAANNWTTLSSSNAPAPQITLNPTSLSFGTQTTLTTSAAQTISVQNTGTSFLSLAGITMSGPNASDFLLSNTCGSTVPSGATCTITVSFKPSVVAAESASIVISGNEAGSPVLAGVTGTGAVAITSGGLVITPSATSAGENGVVTFTANRPVNWALVNGSSGSLISSSSTAATYSAPASIGVQGNIGSCQATPSDSVFNTRIDNLPLESHSATWTVNMGSLGVGFLPSWGTNIADNTTPVQNLTFYYTNLYNGPFVVPQWPNLKREGGVFVTRLNNTDHHILTVRRDNCQFYEIYNNFFGVEACQNGVAACTATSGLTYSWNSYALPYNGATDAAGMPLSPLTLHLDEIKAGVVNHAMRFTVAGGYIHSMRYWPANSGNGCAGCTNSPPYGARFRLKASYDISKFSPSAQVVLTALKQYGMFLADAGTGPTLTVSTDVQEDPPTMGALGQISGAGIGMSNFEAVDESSFIVSNNSLQVNPTNPYQQPKSFAVVTATDQSNSTYQVNFPVALQGVIVGLPSPTMYILGGMSGYQLTSWVNGASNQNVTWTLTSGVGTVTAGGLYTPPASATTTNHAVLTATSVADPAATASLYVTILPNGTNPTGSIRIDAGNPNGTTDGSGNVWLGDQGFETGTYIQKLGDYPNWPSLNSSTERYVYQSNGYTYGDDLMYNFVVPNGNYKVRLMLAQPYNGCNPCVTYNPNWRAPIHIEANGQIVQHNFDLGLPVGYAYATPVDVYIPAQVTNNQLTVALRAVLPDVPTTSSPSPILGGMVITPDTTPAHLAIDSQQQTSVKAGNSLQMYAAGWYMSNAVTWSITGPGSISQTGLYTAPATATSSAQTVTVTISSSANPTIQATTTLTVPASGS